jgi:hypothetical protein
MKNSRELLLLGLKKFLGNRHIDIGSYHSNSVTNPIRFLRAYRNELTNLNVRLSCPHYVLLADLTSVMNHEMPRFFCFIDYK